ncbi:MAG: Flp pilus assembly complex ATPase component TadA [Phycisphaerae bacterium]|nr:Flp pilus assembly complex ATPase component TadA [Phycisphaerae bacterium]
MARKRKKLGEILLEWGRIDPGSLETAENFAKEHDRRLGEALVELELISEDEVVRALAEQFGMEYVDPEDNGEIASALNLIPEDIIRKHLVLPLGKDNGRLKVIIHNPLDLDVQDMLRFRLATEIEPHLASRTKIKHYIDNYLSGRTTESIDKTVDELRQASVDASMDSSMDASVDVDGVAADDATAPIVRLINLIITEAVRSRASDIHVEPFGDRVRVRYRIDGVCIERDAIPKSMQASVISRLKIMAGMHIEQKRNTQDGRIKMHIDDQQIDFRVSCIPSYHGESMVLRILRPESVNIGIQALGFEEDDYGRFQKIIRRPNGIFLVTGPTGSGKTTTLYAALQELNQSDRKIITAEDPVEYHFTGMNQCQVNEALKPPLSFARILRAMLRQAPNIILVGEIRDLEVAEVAIQAALTGHLVFSTLHTNDAPSAITRLIDMGVKPFLVASSVQAIMAQRLIRVICPDCKEVDPNPERHYLRLIGLDPDKMGDKKVYRGKGCKTCHGSGYKGRIGIFEMLEMNAQIRELAFNRAPANKIRKAAAAGGMRSLVEDGRVKILKGVTTPYEVARITQTEEVIANQEA